MVRRAAAIVLDEMGVEQPEMLGARLVLLDDPDEEVRHAAAEGRSKWTKMFPEHHDAVVRRLNDPDPVGAVRLMGQAQEATPELIELHRTILRTANNQSLRTAAVGLARMRANAPEVIADLLEYLDEKFVQAGYSVPPARETMWYYLCPTCNSEPNDDVDERRRTVIELLRRYHKV